MIQNLASLARPFERLLFTPAERKMAYAYFIVMLFGAALSVNVVLTLGGVAAWMTPFTTYDYWVFFCGAIGTGAGLYLGRDWFGHAGKRGAMQAAIGIVWISFVGALIGGTLALPFYGTMFGPFTLVVTLINTPFLAVLWICTLFSTHLMIKQRRIERDSIIYVELPRNTSTYF
jgi:hypothetical protein